MWEKRDFAVSICYAVYFGMVFVGSYFYSWTPVCFLYPLFGPKSKAGMFVNKKFMEFRRYLLDSVDDSGPRNKWTFKYALLYLSYNLNVPMCLYIGTCHLLAVYGVYVLCTGGTDRLLGSWVAPWSHTEQVVAPIKTNTIWFAIALWPISALGITAGSHRLWAHRSYQAHWPYRFVLMLFSSIANQGSIYHWSRDHRTHHRHSDTVADPHDSNRGFFFSHVGWLLVKKTKACLDAGSKIDISDLKADPIVMFQRRLDPWWNLIWCFAVPAFMAMYLWNETLWNAFLVAGVMRYVFVLNATWSVNSIVHKYGPTTYDPTQPPSESRIVAFVALGEGWHSWHHAFAFDYATSELGPLHQFNVTKVLIDLCAKLGLVYGRKRGTRAWNARKEMWKTTQNCEIVESLYGPPLFKCRHLEFVAVEGNSEEVKKLHTIDRVAIQTEADRENILDSILASIPYRKYNATPISVARNVAFVYSVCSLPWAIIAFVLVMDVIVPARWVTASRKMSGL